MLAWFERKMPRHTNPNRGVGGSNAKNLKRFAAL